MRTPEEIKKAGYTVTNGVYDVYGWKALQPSDEAEIKAEITERCPTGRGVGAIAVEIENKWRWKNYAPGEIRAAIRSTISELRAKAEAE